jgi:hypothetical protein
MVLPDRERLFLYKEMPSSTEAMSVRDKEMKMWSEEMSLPGNETTFLCG